MTLSSENDRDAMLRMVLDAMPAAVFIVDADVHIVDANRAARALMESTYTTTDPLRAGEALHCLNAFEHPEGCGRSAACDSCVIRVAVRDAMNGRHSLRLRSRMRLQPDDPERDTFFQITASGFRHREEELVLLVLEDISEFAELRRIVPICAQCKKVRQDEDYWQSVETYLGRYLDLSFSHSYCPACKQDLLRSVDAVTISPRRNPQRGHGA